jgi:YD repeat-containing protein
MPDSFTSRNRLTKQQTGENTNTWGNKLNAAGGSDLLDVSLDGVATISVTGDQTLTIGSGIADQARCRVLKITNGGVTAAFALTAPNVEKFYLVVNTTAFTATIKTSAGAGVAIPAGRTWFVWCDSADFFLAVPPPNLLPLALAAVDLNGQRMTNAGAPIGANDLVTRAFAEALAFTANAGVLPGTTGRDNDWSLVVNAAGTNAEWLRQKRRRNQALDGEPGGAVTARGYDGNGRQNSMTDTFDGTTRTWAWTYDGNGRVQTRAISFEGATRTKSYSYDPTTGRATTDSDVDT